MLILLFVVRKVKDSKEKNMNSNLCDTLNQYRHCLPYRYIWQVEKFSSAFLALSLSDSSFSPKLLLCFVTRRVPTVD